MKNTKLLLLLTLFIMLEMLSSMGSQAETIMHPAQVNDVSPDMCNVPSAYAVAIAWAEEDTGILHLSISVTHYVKGACVNFRLINADVEADGTWADHDFDISASESRGFTSDFHQEFNRNSTIRIVHVQMPNEDAHVIVFCGVPGHRAAGMVADLWVGNAAPTTTLTDYIPHESSNASNAPSLPFPTVVGLISFIAMAVFIRKFKR